MFEIEDVDLERTPRRTILPNLSAIMAAARPNGEEVHDFCIQLGQRMLGLAEEIEGVERTSRSLDTAEE